MKFCVIDDSVSVGFDTPILGNHTDNFETFQALNLTFFFGPNSESQTELSIAKLNHLKNLQIPSPIHWTDHVLHPGLASLALLLSALSILMHLKRYVDQFKLNRRMRLELERIEGGA